MLDRVSYCGFNFFLKVKLKGLGNCAIFIVDSTDVGVKIVLLSHNTNESLNNYSLTTFTINDIGLKRVCQIKEVS